MNKQCLAVGWLLFQLIGVTSFCSVMLARATTISQLEIVLIIGGLSVIITHTFWIIYEVYWNQLSLRCRRIAQSGMENRWMLIDYYRAMRRAVYDEHCDDNVVFLDEYLDNCYEQAKKGTIPTKGYGIDLVDEGCPLN